MNVENAIEVKNLTKVYSGFRLDDVSFQVPTGSVVGFIGENGAGKSTTIKAILGLLPDREGEIQVLGHRIDNEKDDENWKEQIGVVFDECNFPPELKIKMIANVMKNMYQTWDEQKFADYLMKFELPLEKKVKELSKGMKMKLCIAVALSHDSRLLILDEATSGLDPVVRNEILDIFREFVENAGNTIFLSSHITSDIEKIADYIIFIHKGKLLFMENKDDLIYNYALVKCTGDQAARIPDNIIVYREDNSYEAIVLVRDKEILQKGGFMETAAKRGEITPVIDRGGIEDIMLYTVKSDRL